MKTIPFIATVVITLLAAVTAFSQEEGQAVVSADKMNVLFRGIDNPVSIAVPGISVDRIRVSITNGTITGNNGKYTVRVNQGPETSIDVSTETQTGEIRKAGSYTFRVHDIQVPTLRLGSYNPDLKCMYISKKDLLKNPTVTAVSELPPDCAFRVDSFTLTFVLRGDLVSLKSTDNNFTKEMVDDIGMLEKGNKIVIEEVSVSGPGGSRVLPGISITLAAE
jgi:hypothetical protein